MAHSRCWSVCGACGDGRVCSGHVSKDAFLGYAECTSTEIVPQTLHDPWCVVVIRSGSILCTYMLPPSTVSWIGDMGAVRYYVALVPLMFPVCVAFVVINWLAMKRFRHN